MAARPDDWMVEVELVDDEQGGARPDGGAPPDGADGADGAGAALGPEPSRRRPGIGRWALLAAGLSLLVAAVAVGIGVVRGGADDVLRLDHPLAAVWTLPGGALLGAADGVAVIRSGGSVAGYADDDGELLWELQLGAPAVVDACAQAVTTSPAVLWCWRNEQTVQSDTGERAERSAALVGLDVHDGTVVAEHLKTVPWAGVVAVDDDLVVANRVRGTLTLVRLDARSWEREWATDVALAQDPVTGQYEATVEASGDTLVVNGPTAAVVDAADGSVLRTWGGPSDDDARPGGERTVITVTAHGLAAESVLVDGTGTGEGVWYDPAGREVVDYDGTLAEPEVSDGSEPGVVLVSRGRGSELAGVDTATGEDLWTLPTERATVVARQEGAVVVASEGVVTSVELLTGWQQWRTPIAGLRSDAGTAAGGGIAVLMAVQGRAWVFVALDVRSGEQVWTGPAAGTPDLDNLFYIGGAPRLEVVDERLVVHSGQGMTWLS